MELNGETSLSSGFRLLDYVAHRHYGKGDEVLYHPLLFAVLALENTLFGRDFRMWNAANLVFHLLVAYLLFEVLWRTRRSLLACGFALLFGLLASNFELVTWNHLGSYLIGYGLLLAALCAAREMVRDEEHSGVRWFWIYGLAMSCAMLLREIAVIASFGVLVYVIWCKGKNLSTNWKKWIAALGVPIIIYAILYSFHIFQCNRFFWVNPNGAVASPMEYLAAIPLLLGHWLQHIFFPTPGQFVFSFMERSTWMPWTGALVPVLIGVVLWAGLLLCLRHGFERNYLKESLPFGTLIFFLIVSYAGMNVVGRFQYVMEISYYDYFPALFGLVLLYSLIDFSRVGRAGKAGALACLLLLAVNNGLQVRSTSYHIQEVNYPAARYLRSIEQAVRPKLSNPDFYFFLKDIPPELDIELTAMLGYPDQGEEKVMSLFRVLYGKYYKPEKPGMPLLLLQ
jgi:hypothetical protein